jgi:hypothetical protein
MSGLFYSFALAPVPVTNGENANYPLSIYMRLRPKRHEETFDKGHTGIRER